MPYIFVEIWRFCSSHHVWSRLQHVRTALLPRVPPLWFRYCDQAGGLVALGALEKRGQWLHLFPIEKDYRSWRPWLITQRQTSEYGQGKVQLFNSSHTQSIQTSCWHSFPHLPALSSQWPLPSTVFLSPFMAHIIIWGRSCCNWEGAWTTLYFYWRWVSFFFLGEWLIDFVNAFGDQWFLNNKWPLWSSASHIVYCVFVPKQVWACPCCILACMCVCLCVCWSIVTFSGVRCVCAQAEKYFSQSFFSKTLQIHKHFRAATTMLTDAQTAEILCFE